VTRDTHASTCPYHLFGTTIEILGRSFEVLTSVPPSIPLLAWELLEPFLLDKPAIGATTRKHRETSQNRNQREQELLPRWHSESSRVKPLTSTIRAERAERAEINCHSTGASCGEPMAVLLSCDMGPAERLADCNTKVITIRAFSAGTVDDNRQLVIIPSTSVRSGSYLLLRGFQCCVIGCWERKRLRSPL
jgi:hypothetical protein